MKWEYLEINSCIDEHAKFNQGLLNFHGGNGWELVAIHNDLFYFKRPLKEEVPEEVLRDVLK